MVTLKRKEAATRKVPLMTYPKTGNACPSPDDDWLSCLTKASVNTPDCPLVKPGPLQEGQEVNEWQCEELVVVSWDMKVMVPGTTYHKEAYQY